MKWRKSGLFTAKSFRAKLMIASVVCILIPALVTLVVYNYLTRDAVKDQAILNADQTLKLVEGHVSNELRYMLYLMNYFTVDQDMLFLLKNLASEPFNQNRESASQYVTGSEVRKSINSLTAAGQKSFLTVVLKNGMTFTNYLAYEYDPLLLFKEPWMETSQSIFGLQSLWVGTVPTVYSSEKRSNPYQLTAVRPLRGDKQAIYGYVVVTVLESLVHQYFEDLPTEQEIMLLDQQDTVLSHRDTTRIGTSFPYLKDSERAGKSSNIVRIDDRDYLISKRDISINGWKLVSLTPYKSAVSKINGIFENVFLFQLISFIIFFILLLIALRAFTQPLVKLDKVALRVQKGDLNVRSSIRGQDEVGRLGKSFDQMLDRISDMIQEITHTQARKRKAELDMLQAQINPHFLFNVMNSIRMKVLGQGDRESADMLSSLSKLLRMTIQDTGLIPLHDEVETAINYTKLMNMRQKQKATLQVDIAVEVFLEKVPRLFLQPIIENALIHGLNQREGTIYLHACVVEHGLEYGFIKVMVKDDGQGMDEATLEDLRSRLIGLPPDETMKKQKKGFSGIGLPNVYERLRMTFGGEFRMEVISTPGQGTCVTLYLPKQKEENAHV
jgi:two-component system, sensor histidine kinase YesM